MKTDNKSMKKFLDLKLQFLFIAFSFFGFGGIVASAQEAVDQQGVNVLQNPQGQQNDDPFDINILFPEPSHSTAALPKVQNAFLSRFTRTVSLARDSHSKKTQISIERKNSSNRNGSPAAIVVEISDISHDPNVQKSLDNLSEESKRLFFERRDAILIAVAAILPKISRVQTFATTVAEKVRNGVHKIRSQVIELDDPSTKNQKAELKEQNLFNQLEEINQTLFIFSNKVINAEEIQFAMSVGAGFMAHVAKYSKGTIKIPGVKVLDGLGLAVGIGYNFKTKSATMDIFTDSARFYKQFIPLVVSFGANASYSIRAIMADGAVPSIADSGYTVGLPGVPFTVSSFDKEMSITGYIPGAPSVTLPVSIAISGAVRTTLLSLDMRLKTVRVANFEVKVPVVGMRLADPVLAYMNHFFHDLNLTSESQAEVDIFDRKLEVPAQAATSFLKARYTKFQNVMLKFKGSIVRTCSLLF